MFTMDKASASSKFDAPTSFLSLPRELRNMIYAYVLTDDEYIDLGPWIHHSLSSQFLRTNKTIHDESSEVLYSQNLFNFMYHSDELLSFFDQIGAENSKHIRHIRIDFPTFRYLDPGKVTLTEESTRVLEKLKDCCGNLRTLTTSRSSTDGMEHRLDNLDHPNVVTEALKLVDAHFRAISSPREKESPTMAFYVPTQSSSDHDSSCILSTVPSTSLPDHDSGNPMLSIVVEVYEDGPNDDVRRKMESHGWILDAAENVEEDDRSFGEIDDDVWDRIAWGHDDGGDHDNYDIDNDSDFWRRAGD